MIQSPRYVHTNLIARDWRLLAQFYTGVFGCEFVPPERDYAGAAEKTRCFISSCLTAFRMAVSRITARTPDCQYEVIPNADHMASMDNPEVFNQLVMAFLAKWIPVAVSS